MKLFIDDERKASPEFTHTASSVEEAISFLEHAKETGEDFELVSFDFDAHWKYDWTFMEVAEWIRDNDFWPQEIRIHTLNSWTGRPWLTEFFQKYAPPTVLLDLTDPWDIDGIINGTSPAWVREFQEALS